MTHRGPASLAIRYKVVMREKKVTDSICHDRWWVILDCFNNDYEVAKFHVSYPGSDVFARYYCDDLNFVRPKLLDAYLLEAVETILRAMPLGVVRKIADLADDIDAIRTQPDMWRISVKSGWILTGDARQSSVAAVILSSALSKVRNHEP